MNKATLAVVMPAYNEAAGLAEFLGELSVALSEYFVHFVIIDDCSTDQTVAVAAGCRAGGLRVTVRVNEVNSGHGPSTVSALRAGVETGAHLIVATDGDGQFLGEDVATAVAHSLTTGADIVEGVRTQRGDALFRRLTSAITRALVGMRAGSRPMDANTPLRIYRRDVLADLLAVLPLRAMTPNLLVSSISRAEGLRVEEIPVVSVPRRGETALGSTWGQRRRTLPSKRFLLFCRDAVLEWFRTPRATIARPNSVTAPVTVPVAGSRWWAVARQFASYVVLGGLGAATDYAVFWGLQHTNVHHIAANIVSVVCGIMVSFFLNSRFTFARLDHQVQRMTKFFAVGLSGLALSTGLLDLLITRGMGAMWAKLVTLPVIAVLQFIANRMWTFHPIGSVPQSMPPGRVRPASPVILTAETADPADSTVDGGRP